MCGRFVQKAKPKEIKKEFKIGQLNPTIFQPHYNIAPSRMIPAVLEKDGMRIVEPLKWGLIPSWSKDDSFASKLINARSETLSEKPSFREAFKKRRCIIPASGFYEWDKKGKGAKQPYYFYLKDKEVFGFAGLWEEWTDKESGEITQTCTIITTEANEILEPIHDRMPVILREENYSEWLDEREKDTHHLEEFFVPFPGEKMDSYPVSRDVNNPGNNSAELIKKAHN